MATLIDWNALSQKIDSYMGDSPYFTTDKISMPYKMLYPYNRSITSVVQHERRSDD
jgi:hypothetical protein